MKNFKLPDILNNSFIVEQAHQIQINASTPNDLTEANVRNRLKLGDPVESPSTTKRSMSTPTQSQDAQSPVSPKSPSQEMEFDEAAARQQESERRAQEEAERATRERDAADRRKAEQVAREALQRRQLEDERKEREKAAAKAESDRKAREEAERKRNEELRSKFAELEKSGKVIGKFKKKFFPNIYLYIFTF
jgi:hypothetical protein